MDLVVGVEEDASLRRISGISSSSSAVVRFSLWIVDGVTST